MVAMADVYSRRRDQAKSRVPGIQTVDDHRRLLDMKDIDAVIVASPLHIHTRHFLDTLGRRQRSLFREDHDLVDSGGRPMPGGGEESDRVVQIGLQHESSGALVDAQTMD